MKVGTRVLILTGWWAGEESVITEMIEPLAQGDPVRYDVDAAPGRYYRAEEVQIVIEADDTYTPAEALAALSARAGRPITDKLLRRFVRDGLLTPLARPRRFLKSEVDALDIQAHFERVRQAHHALANRSFSALARRHEVRIAEHRANGPQTGLPHNSA